MLQLGASASHGCSCCVQPSSEPVTKDAVLTWLEGVTTASIEDIANGLNAKMHTQGLQVILQELQGDFEIATKAGKYFTL